MRFRNYLGEQYKKTDKVNEDEIPLPITTIYILGFNLQEINTPCLKVERNYKDLSENKIINQKCTFIESLTHDSYIVQVERITNKYYSVLDKLLSIFEQSNFVDDKKIVKEFSHEINIEELKIAINNLNHSSNNPEE